MKIQTQIVLWLLAFVMLTACRKSEQFQLKITTHLSEGNIIKPKSTLQLYANMPVVWRVDSTAGTINANGLFTAKNAVEGKFFIKAFNPQNAIYIDSVAVFITPADSLLKLLRQGGYVLSFRHAWATRGVDIRDPSKPEWWKSCSDTLARQLDSTGLKQAVDMGAGLKNLSIQTDKIYSSEYCRCFTTAQLFNMSGNITTDTSITYWVYNESNRLNYQLSLINAQPAIANGKNVFIIGHTGFSSSPLALLNPGDACLYKANSVLPEPLYIGTIYSRTFTSMK